MSVIPGERLGPYEIVALIGAGGMGEVYRAHDTRLNRDVALKVLPEIFARDTERMARFEREAKLLASLNHNNIAAIYGLEESGATRALVMELVEGPNLAERIAAGPIPLDEALPIARQIADAVEYAHDQNVIHRDLKPANIKVKEDGTVKVLDFGLAKALSDEVAESDMSNSPTLSMAATRQGMILGTAAYMSPEQAKGKRVDRRTDVWAFGCVLYEMLTGKAPFQGEDVTEILAAIVMKEPAFDVLPAKKSAAIRTLLRRCLEKNPRRRPGHMSEARILIEDVLSGAGPAEPLAAASSTRERIVWAVVTVAAALVGYAVFFFTQQRPERPAAIRFEISPPPGTFFANGVAAPLHGLSPDGRRIAFPVLKGTSVQLAVRSLDALESQLLPGTEGPNAGTSPYYAFWSPDSRFIGFFVQGKLKKIDVTGGPPQVLCDAPAPEGGTWNQDGAIVFGNGTGGLFRVSAAGGTPVPVTTLDAARNERSHRAPWFLPDGRHFIYVAQAVEKGTNAPPTNTVFVGSLDSPDRIELFTSDSRAVYSDEHLLFVREGTLLAQPFDLKRLSVTGEPFPVAEDLGVNSALARAAFSVSATGVLTYRSNTGANGEWQLAWFDRSGQQTALVGDYARQDSVALSPDGKRAAVSLRDPGKTTGDIWIYDVDRGVPTRVTADTATEDTPIWSPDGSRIVFFSDRTGHRDLYQKASNGVSADERLLADSSTDSTPASWSPDGRFLLYTRGGPRTGSDLWALPLFGDRKPVPVLQDPFNQLNGRFSPDGRWIAYVSNETGGTEIYVVPFPGPGDKVRISSNGGAWPRWRRDGKELFYLGPGFTVMAASVNGHSSRFEVIETKALFSVSQMAGTGGYDVSADGQRFLLLAEPRQAAPLTVVVNWTAGLRK
jgi:eukaryotic-like serine/threonine-protein kinase